VSYINSVNDISAIDISDTITTVYNASIQTYTLNYYPLELGNLTFYLPGPGIYTMRPQIDPYLSPINPLYEFYINSPGRYIICNQGISYTDTSDTPIDIRVYTSYYPGYYDMIIQDDTLQLAQTLTFDVFVSIKISGNGPPVIFSPALLGANKVIAPVLGPL
jgi:hypothetical protein